MERNGRFVPRPLGERNEFMGSRNLEKNPLMGSVNLDRSENMGSRHFERRDMTDSRNMERNDLMGNRNYERNEIIGSRRNLDRLDRLGRNADRLDNIDARKIDRTDHLDNNVHESVEHLESKSLNRTDLIRGGQGSLRPTMPHIMGRVARSPSEGELSSESSSLQAPDLPFQLIPRAKCL